MTTYIFTCPTTGQRWQRVHATKAKKLFAMGVELRGIPCKMALFGVWSTGGFTAQIDSNDTDEPTYQFHRIERSIWGYNCCAQLGYDVAWYVKEEEVIKHRFKKCK